MGDWKQRARERVKDKKEGSSFKLSEGDNCLRILPNKRGSDEAPFLEYRVHYSVGPDKKRMTCGYDVDGHGKCWLCDLKIPELLRGNTQKRQLAQEIISKEQFMVQVSRIDTETKKWGMPKAWYVPTGMSAKSLSVVIQSLLASNKRSYEHPTKGYNLNIERTGTGLATRYGNPIPDESPSKVPTAVLEAIKELESFVPTYSEEEQKAAYYGRPQEDDEEEGVTPDESNNDEEEEESEEPEEVEDEQELDEVESEAEDEEEELDVEEPEEIEEEDDLEEVEDEPPPPPKKAKSAPSKPAPKPKPARK